MTSAMLYGGVLGGVQIIGFCVDRWMATPVGGLTRRFAGIVTSMMFGASSVNRLSFAAVQ